MRELARLLAGIADPTRLRLLRLLQGRELCVCELVDALRLPQYAVSRQLRELRAMGLAEARRDGRWMHYRLGPAVACTPFVQALIDLISREWEEHPSCRQDDARLARRIGLRRSGQCVVGMRGPCGPARERKRMAVESNRGEEDLRVPGRPRYSRREDLRVRRRGRVAPTGGRGRARARKGSAVRA